MFPEATRKIVKEIDHDGYTLIPLTSLYHSDSYKPLYLVRKKKSIFKKTRYLPTSITVPDILKEGPDLDFGLQSSGLSCYTERFIFSVSGSVGASACVAEAGLGASGSVSNTISALHMIKGTISEERLLQVANTRKVDRGHNFVKQLHNDTVYIISEVVETDKPCSLKRSSSAAGSLSLDMEEELSIPAGTTIAYKVLELGIMHDGTLGIHYKVMFGGRPPTSSSSSPKAGIATSLVELTKLSKDVSLQFLNAILENLVQSDNLPVLETMLDQMCEGLQPDLQVLDLMEDQNRVCVEKMLGLLGIQKADPPGQALTLTPHQDGVMKALNILIESLSGMI
uniref:pejvakin-like n=1 Tax=Pristiophorus japonicus TaxID=55135 RepID=UPI00398F2361